MVSLRRFLSPSSPAAEQAVGDCPAAEGSSLEPGAVGKSQPAVPGDPRVWDVMDVMHVKHEGDFAATVDRKLADYASSLNLSPSKVNQCCSAAASRHKVI